MCLSKIPYSRDLNNHGTLARAQVTIDALAEASDIHDLRDLHQSAQGWITALWIESLIGRTEYDRLLKALDVARLAWQPRLIPSALTESSF